MTNQYYSNNPKYFNFCTIDGYQKEFNLIIAPRNVGKTTALENGKILKAWRKSLCVVYYLRKHVGIDIEAIKSRINKLLPEYEQIDFKYSKGDLKSGRCRVNIKIGGGEWFIGLLCLSLNQDKQTIKNTAYQSRIAFEVFDEYVVDTKNDKYMDDEWNLFLEAHNTISKSYDESVKNHRVYFMGNPYSRYTPFFVAFNIDSRLIKPNTLLNGFEWAVQVYDMKNELKKELIETHKITGDENYINYATTNSFLNDENINVVSYMPVGYSFNLVYYIIYKSIKMMVFYGHHRTQRFSYVKKTFDDVKNKKMFAFDLNEVGEKSEIRLNNFKDIFFPLKFSLMKYRCFFSHVECFYLLKELFEKNKL